MSQEALTTILGFSATTLLILLGFGTYWIRMRGRLLRRELEKRLERLERTSEENAQRLEDLETIIVSEAGRTRPIAAGPHQVHTLDAGMDRQRAADLARRLRG
jgi:hypothetical protein